MSEEVIVRLGAPTLAGIKTGSLFTCAYTSRKSVEESLRQLNRCFAPKGLCLLPLRYSEKNVLLYLFRPAELSRDLQNSEAFPHEIGLFLSYPPEDVKGFIENRAANYKLSGLWKVYGDEKKAKELFVKYKKCTDIYCERYEAGCGIAELAVAV